MAGPSPPRERPASTPRGLTRCSGASVRRLRDRGAGRSGGGEEEPRRAQRRAVGGQGEGEAAGLGALVPRGGAVGKAAPARGAGWEAAGGLGAASARDPVAETASRQPVGAQLVPRRLKPWVRFRRPGLTSPSCSPKFCRCPKIPA